MLAIIVGSVDRYIGIIWVGSNRMLILVDRYPIPIISSELSRSSSSF